MIPRILVPKNARLAASPSEVPPRRLTSELDSRTLVPSNLPHIELDPRTSIPSHIPLGVLGSRTVVPRDMPHTPLDGISKMPDYVPLSILDSRVAVPKDAHAGKLEPRELVAIQDLPDVIDPDVLTTGEVNLMAHPVEERTAAWNAIARFASIAVHFLVILLILFGPSVTRNPTQTEIDRQNITNLYLPPDVRDVPKSIPRPQPKSPQIRVDPRLLRQLAPPRELQPTPAPPEPERVVKEAPTPTKPVPSAPVPQPRTQPPQDSPIRPQPQESASNSLVLPRFSPGKALQESMHEALKDGGTSSAQFGGPVGPAPSPGGGGMGSSGGGGQGYLGGNLEMLTPTEGVDFTNYLARVLASVKRNWFAVMPESARLGDRGKVVLQFRIMRNGVVPDAEPAMVGSSSKEPLDRAAISSIRASTPFEPLPPAFSGPFIELRFIFLYNMPLNDQ
jgi:TonB family protein